jgi:hypothetical protein
LGHEFVVGRCDLITDPLTVVEGSAFGHSNLISTRYYLINGAIIYSEGFNKFAQWVSFGGHGILAENNRDDQRKLIKYNHLVANCLIFYNVFAMTKALHKLKREGVHLSAEVLGRLSPYLTSHVNRFGIYHLELDRQPPAIDYKLPILSV